MTADDPDPVPADWQLDLDLEDRAIPVFASLLDLSGDARAAALARACGDDARLRLAVERLLADHGDPPAILSAMLAQDARRREPGAIGEMLGPYRIEGRIGSGGMGVVYRAEQDRPRRKVALKVLTHGAGDPDLVARFEHEVEVLGRLQHPGICRIYGAGSVAHGGGLDPVHFFAMELLDGVPLTEFARVRALGVAARCELVVQLCAAIEHAHARGVVHRDLKPNNILVVEGVGGAPMVKVLDFGIARSMTEGAATAAAVTRTGLVLGTLDYMSPEQLLGRSASIDGRSDVYAIGVLLYELLGGRLPLSLDGLDLAAVCRVVSEREPPRLGRLVPALRGDFETVVGKALNKEPGDRYATVAELGADLQRILRGEPIRARRATTFYQLRKFAQRNRGLVGGVLAAIVVLASGLVGVAVLAAHNDALATREQLARGEAETARERLRESLYRSQMRLGTEAMHVPGGVPRVREIVAPWLPAAGERDLRGFEWWLLSASCRREERVGPGEAAPSTIQWLADGRLVTMHQQARIFWDAATGELLSRSDDEVLPTAIGAVAQNGRWLVEAAAEDSVVLRDLANGEAVRRFEHDGRLQCCSLLADGSLLLCVVDGREAVLWDTRTHRRVAAWPGPCIDARLSADGGMVAIGRQAFAGDVQVRVFRADDWTRPWRELRGGGESLFRVALDGAGTRLAATSYEGVLSVWRLDSGELERSIQHADSLRDLAFAPDGQRLAVGCRDYCAYVHDLRTGAARRLAGHTGIVSSLCWSPDGALLVTAGDDATLRWWRPDRPEVRREVRLPPRPSVECAQLDFDGAGERLAIHVGEPAAMEWNLATGALQAGPLPLARDAAAMAAAGMLPFRFAAARPGGGAAAYVRGRTGPLWVWRDGEAAPRSYPVPWDVRGLVWCADGHLATVDLSDTVRLLDADSGREVLAHKVPECTLALAAAPHDDALAIGCVDQAVRLWSPTRGDLATLRGHTGHVQAVAFAADGRRLASGGRDRTVRLWDVAAAAEVASLPMPNWVVAVAFSPDAMRLAAIDSLGIVVVWDARTAGSR